MEKARKTTKKWLKFRHRVITKLAHAVIAPYSRWKYGIKIEKFREQEKRPYLILLNHQTPYDQFFVGISFRDPIYYMASEDIFSNGFVSSLIRYAVAPIPIKKQTTDLKAVKTCIRVAREGGTIAIAPEGNRTYSGRTEYMSPTIAPLAKKLGMPIALYRIEGGYGAQPRWSDVVRKGKMRSYVSRVIQPEEYANLTNDELFAMIQEGLYVNEAVADTEFAHPKLAEYLERAMYVCPYCGLSEFESHGDIVECKKCHRQIRYRPSKELEGVGFAFPYPFVAQWYDAQADFINELNLLEHDKEPLYREKVQWSEVIPYKRKQLLAKETELCLYGTHVTIGAERWSFDEISAVVVLGRNKLNIYHDNHIYQFKCGKRFNALKYVHFFHRYKNLTGENKDGKFLGL